MWIVYVRNVMLRWFRPTQTLPLINKSLETATNLKKHLKTLLHTFLKLQATKKRGFMYVGIFLDFLKFFCRNQWRDLDTRLSIHIRTGKVHLNFYEPLA